MKKTYSQPACVVVALGTMQMMAASLPIGDGTGSGSTIDNPGQILTKENKDVNLWDDEW